jgi:hypothetical protein
LAVLNSAKVACCADSSITVALRPGDFALTVPKKNTKKAQEPPNPKTRANASPSLAKYK